MKIVCVIPARYASTRLPGKPLAMIGGAPMIEWVYRRALRVDEFTSVIVATDDKRIFDAVNGFGGVTVMTPSELPSGTDSVAFLAGSTDADVFVNLQGDEPLINPEVLKALCKVFSDPEVYMATPVRKITNIDELIDPNNARVIIDQSGNAMYFTRAVIPFNMISSDYSEWLKADSYYKHIGIYAYRKDFLLRLSELPVGKLEKIEKLEQLRVLENGFKIRTIQTNYTGISIDTKEDLEYINNYVLENEIKVDSADEFV